MKIFLKLFVICFLISLSGCSSDDKASDSIDPLYHDCPQGYTGLNCTTQITPSKIKVTKITIKIFPPTNNGSSWDGPTDGSADIYPVLLNPQGQTIYNSPNYFSNAMLGIDYVFTPSSPIVLYSVNDAYALELYDFDGADTISNEDDFMIGATFFPYSSTGGFPATKIFSSESFAFELSFQYEW